MAGRVDAGCDGPLRVVAYIRVSQEREEMISPELQMIAITNFCARAGYVIVATLTDLDLTGRFWQRRQVEQAVAMIESGAADVLMVWKWSRLARNRLDWAVAVDRIETAGGRLESATEPADTATSTGRLARGMLAEFAAFEGERIGDGWREALDRRTSHGLPHSGKPRWGYRYEQGEYSPDRVTGPILADLYRRYTAGESVASLGRWLDDNGLKTNRDGQRSGNGQQYLSVLIRMLDAGFGAGFIIVHGEKQAGAHEPVITQNEWGAYLRARELRKPVRSYERQEYLMTEFVRCFCRSELIIRTNGAASPGRFICPRGAPTHHGANVAVTVVDATVLLWLGLVTQEPDKTREADLKSRVKAHLRKQDARRLAKEVSAFDVQLADIRGGYASGLTLGSADLAVRSQINSRRTALMAELRQAQRDAHRIDPMDVAQALVEDWDELSIQLRRDALQQLVDHVSVTPGRPRSMVTIVPTWEV
jgi:site-specific DNA recombinase